MKISVEQIKRVGGYAIESLLGVFLLVVMLQAWTANQAQASAVTNPNVASAAASLLPVQATPVFDCCIQDDTSGAFIAFSSTTGDYMVNDCDGFTLTGVGVVRVKGCTKSLNDAKPGRKVVATLSSCNGKGTAGVQPLPGSPTLTIMDKNTTNNTCACETEENGQSKKR